MNDRSSISTEAVTCLINMSVKNLGPSQWLVQYELWLFIWNAVAKAYILPHISATTKIYSASFIFTPLIC